MVTVTQKTVESIQVVIARQNSFIQGIDTMSTNMKELMETTRAMDYSSLKLGDTIQEDNEVMEGILLQTRGLQELFARRWDYLVWMEMSDDG